MRTRSDKPYRFICRADRNIQVVFKHLPGKLVSAGTRDISEAVRFAEDFLESNGMSNKKTPTLGEFAKDFFIRTDSLSIRAKQLAFGKTVGEKWYKDNQAYLDNFIIPTFGDYQINAITPLSIENWIVGIKQKSGKALSSDSKNKVLHALNLVLTEAIRLGYMTSNPLEISYKPKVVTENPRRALTLHEQRMLFPENKEQRKTVWKSTLWAAYFSIMYDTGFRPGEVAGLRVCDVYRTPGGMGVYTSHTISCFEEKAVERVKTSGKGMENRVGLLSDISEALVLELIKENDLKDEDWLFEITKRKDNTRFLYPRDANPHLKSVCKELGLDESITQYYIRHTYATYRRGRMDEATLALSMGHSNGVRSDYDHRTASILLAQLEKARDDIFSDKDTDHGIEPLKTGAGK